MQEPQCKSCLGLTAGIVFILCSLISCENGSYVIVLFDDVVLVNLKFEFFYRKYQKVASKTANGSIDSTFEMVTTQWMTSTPCFEMFSGWLHRCGVRSWEANPWRAPHPSWDRACKRSSIGSWKRFSDNPEAMKRAPWQSNQMDWRLNCTPTNCFLVYVYVVLPPKHQKLKQNDR